MVQEPGASRRRKLVNLVKRNANDQGVEGDRIASSMYGDQPTA